MLIHEEIESMKVESYHERGIIHYWDIIEELSNWILNIGFKKELKCMVDFYGYFKMFIKKNM